MDCSFFCTPGSHPLTPAAQRHMFASMSFGDRPMGDVILIHSTDQALHWQTHPWSQLYPRKGKIMLDFPCISKSFRIAKTLEEITSNMTHQNTLITKLTCPLGAKSVKEIKLKNIPRLTS
jgi:hypothetical protein